MKVPILPEPPRPGFLRICPQCSRWFALQLQAVRMDETVGKVQVYRCSQCDHVREYAARLPEGAV
ncbi:hypothetical protein NA78x_005918 [Anatilimnocola sp. NA78]|uniref:hypothetical protein n=1 Tax=Anatilimnocola sp. NA78 TaxID=3415683 RepID=UPI003CE5334E